MIDLDRVRDLELLRQVAKLQDAEIGRLRERLSELTRELASAKGLDTAAIQAELALLTQELNEAHARTLKGGSERRPRPTSDEPKDEKPKSGHGPTPQPRLPIEEAPLHVLDDADKVCTACGGGLEPWVGQTEDSEEVDVVELRYVLKKHRRQKYRCKCGGCIEVAPGPLKLVPGGRYSLAFAIHVAIQKYADHLPLERQTKIMARSGLDVESQTLWDQLFALSRCFTVAIERLHKYLLAKEVLMADESRWPLLGTTGRPTKNWFDWVLVGDDAVLHSIYDSRSNEAADRLLAGFKGVLVTDGYGVYGSRAKALGFTLAHDWVHARRYFLEAEPTAPVAAEFLDDIGKLFLVERDIAAAFDGKTREVARELRRKMRAEQSKPIVARIGERAATVRALRDSPIAQAIRYLENQWEGLTVFLDDPRVPITTNLAEGALRSLVLGRNNHLGSKSRRGCEVAAIFYTLIENARLSGLDPARYLFVAAEAHLHGRQVPLPHELRQALLDAPAGPSPLAAPGPIPATT